MVLMKTMRDSFSGLKIVSKGEKIHELFFSSFSRIKIIVVWGIKYEIINFVKQGWDRHSKN